MQHRKTYRSLCRLPDVVEVSVWTQPGSDHPCRGVSSEKVERPSVGDDLMLATSTPTGLAIAGDDSPSFYRHGNAGNTLAACLSQGSDVGQTTMPGPTISGQHTGTRRSSSFFDSVFYAGECDRFVPHTSTTNADPQTTNTAAAT